MALAHERDVGFGGVDQPSFWPLLYDPGNGVVGAVHGVVDDDHRPACCSLDAALPRRGFHLVEFDKRIDKKLDWSRAHILLGDAGNSGWVLFMDCPVKPLDGAFWPKVLKKVEHDQRDDAQRRRGGCRTGPELANCHLRNYTEVNLWILRTSPATGVREPCKIRPEETR